MSTTMSEAHTIGSFLRNAAKLLRPISDTPELDAQCLLSFVLGRNRTYLATWPERILEPQDHALALALTERRSLGEPIAYLVGNREFYGRDFEVNRAVLIPRPETELLVETVLNATGTHCLTADLGTGSGCILVTLLAERPGWSGIGADISPDALAVAKRNAVTHSVLSRACFICADFTDILFQPRSLDVVVSNPPYISSHEYVRLMPDVREYEPATALVPQCRPKQKSPDCHKKILPSHATGLEHLKSVAHMAGQYLKPGGFLAMEMGCDQGWDVLQLLKDLGCWNNARIIQDFAGRDRVVTAIRA